MIRIDSSWSRLPHSPNIIAPRQSGLTLTPVAPRLRSCMAPQLVDRCEPGFKSVARGAQVEAPDTRALRTSEPRGFVDVVVEPARPLAQGLGVVALEALDVLDLHAGSSHGERDPRQRQRVPAAQDVALGDWPGSGGVRVQPGDGVVQHPAPG